MMLGYPNTPLKPQVRPLEKTFSGFTLLRALFARRAIKKEVR